ncbi:YceK/YidQ family lipoprotein [Sodalis sp. dw_96]|uniref:YceK/YidQ family lipoprotein n=1 Tax=Sodalis sp. dw_96 TaxID=2719794 RepID=UPI001BD54DA6|nr:YceK/YidQ family lipoprotein [Sodalis sp. dw_96]
MLKTTLLFLTASCALMGGTGCSSVMTHTGPNQGYYPGTRASLAVLEDDDTSWSMIPFAAVDLPFSAVLDTMLLPYDYLRRDSDKRLESPRERMLHGDPSANGHNTPPAN